MSSSTIQKAGTRVYRTVNPATGELVREIPGWDAEGVEAALARSHAAFLSWRDEPVARKALLFRALADLIDEHTEELSRQVSEEMGKPVAQARMEAGIASSMFRYYADNGEELLADEEVAVPGFARTVTRREPVGVVLGIEPWNGPMYQAMRATAPNLMLGNTVMVKPASICAASTLIFDDLFRRAGFPADVYQTALISSGQAMELIADPRVRAVTLTGSNKAGAEVGAQAGRHVKPVVLELGGSDPFIVLDSADVAAASGMASVCRLALGGQICVSPKRVIVTDKVADEFIAQYTAVFASQNIGDPFDPETTLGPVSSVEAADELQELYQDAVDKGATVLVPGGRMTDRPGAFFAPAVLTDITPEMRLYSEEAFGPIGMIYRVADADEAIAIANDTEFGLGGTVFAQDLDEARRVADALDTGAVGINGYLAAPIEIPFGGTKSSGVGRELGRTGMDAFANIKTYAIA